ncbi:class I SAM-dependent methyltransferase [Actinokineospora enzanensis]|uniref:class I SAM-dependent methyltransferase n=1 Tax=Actinokineospora enzanensis TaxID=155975 RepID=UPI0003A7CFAA|nr:class I SAM-dependent methyltransferase [Actinokineospora enzanensis]
MTLKSGRRWNHNIHYHPRILRAVPAEVRDALDVGCGEGMLARALRRRVPKVTGIDLHAPSVEEAAGYDDDIDYVVGDFLTHRFEPGSFDVVTSVATLHHVDAETGLARLRELVRPGGVLAVVGLARGSLPYTARGMAASTLHRLVKGHWEHPSPTVWPPPETFTRMRELSEDLLPGSHYRRHVLLRYSLVWRKPTG